MHQSGRSSCELASQGTDPSEQDGEKKTAQVCVYIYIYKNQIPSDSQKYTVLAVHIYIYMYYMYG